MATPAPEKRSRIAVDLGDRGLYHQLRVAAVENDMTVRDIVIEAVRFWLEHREDIEDTLAAEKIGRRKANPEGPQLSHEDVKRRSRSTSPARQD